jgi:hypothetical protein
MFMQGLAGLVDGDHYFDTIAPDAVFEFRYRFPGYPTKVVGREALMALYAGYGEGMALHRADALVVNISQTPGVVILEYEVQGNAVRSGKLYENRYPRHGTSTCGAVEHAPGFQREVAGVGARIVAPIGL